MKTKLNIKGKMLLFILSTSILIFGSTIGYISIKNHRLSIDYANKIVKNVSTKNALLIEKSLSENLHVLKTLAQAFSVYTSLPEDEWKPLFIDMYKKVYVQNPDFYKLWDSWELSFFDSTWNHNYGRYAVTVFDDNNHIEFSTSLRSMDGDAGMYAQIKSIDKNMLWEPYWDEFLEAGEEKKFMTSISAPIKVDGKYAGIVAADIIVNRFQKIVENINPYDGTTSFLVSNSGVFVGHSNHQLIGKNIAEIAPEYNEQFNISERIKNGDLEVFKGKNEDGNFILTIAPINIGEHKAPWALGLIIPERQILAQANEVLKYSLIAAIIGLLLLASIVIYIARKISSSIITTTKVLQNLATGDIGHDSQITINSGDEVEEMADSVNHLIVGLNKTTAFANQIEKGNLNANFTPLSDKDTLGNALLQMRESLLEAEKSENLRKIEDEKQNWATNGLAKFSEILRDNTKNINALSYSILSHLINYLDINQGAIFIKESNDEDTVSFNLTAAVAYGREKLLNKKIALGEGLVGRCAFEMKTIYLTDIPAQYMDITSGLGTANPTIILLVPLLLNDEVHGVIELASFSKLEPYQIEFIETIGESIASTISSVKVSETTEQLLNQAKSQAEELAAQEEEMRQNMEELHATQEESVRRESEMDGIITALGQTAYLIELDTTGNILTVNAKFEEFINASSKDIIRKKWNDIWQFDSTSFESILAQVQTGKSLEFTNKTNFNGKEQWIAETYSPVTNLDNGSLEKIILIAYNVSHIKIE